MSDEQQQGSGGDDESLNELQRMLRELLGDGASMEGFDPEGFARAAGLTGDSAALRNLFASLQNAARHPQEGIDWSITRRIALDIAGQAGDDADPAPALRAFPVAGLWLDEITDVAATSDAPRTISRIEWVQQTVDTWVSLAEPVAESISQSLVDALTTQLPEEFADSVGNFLPMLRSVGGTLFATQLGQVIGKLAQEVIAGGDIGIPLFTGPGREGGSLVPGGVAAFARGLEQDSEAVTLYLAVRETAHARLFRHAKWLRLHMFTAISDYARGISIDTDRIQDLAGDIDPSDTERIKELVASGALIPPKTEAQEAAHDRLETMLALVEGWVDAVTAEATRRMPGAEAISEMVRRRRATGGPAEHAFSTLAGLELRPRRLREAAALWRLVAERGGREQRDSLWAHPDLLPTSEELDHPARLLERLGLAGSEPAAVEPDDFDLELAKILDSGLEGLDSPDSDGTDSDDRDSDGTDLPPTP